MNLVMNLLSNWSDIVYDNYFFFLFENPEKCRREYIKHEHWACD